MTEFFEILQRDPHFQCGSGRAESVLIRIWTTLGTGFSLLGLSCKRSSMACIFTVSFYCRIYWAQNVLVRSVRTGIVLLTQMNSSKCNSYSAETLRSDCFLHRSVLFEKSKNTVLSKRKKSPKFKHVALDSFYFPTCT